MPLQSPAPFPQLAAGLDPAQHRAQIEATIEHLIAMLDELDAPSDDLEPEPDEESGDDEPTDEEDRWVPVSLNVERSPPRQVRSARWLRAQSLMAALHCLKVERPNVQLRREDYAQHDRRSGQKRIGAKR